MIALFNLQHVLEIGGSFQPTCFAHPETYLNKIVVGSKAGQVQLWNFVTGRMLYTFSVAESAVRCIVPSPALDVVAIGLSDGCACSPALVLRQLLERGLKTSGGTHAH